MQTTTTRTTPPPLPMPPRPTGDEPDAAPAREPWFRLTPLDGWLTVVLVAICVFLTVLSIQSVTPAWAPGMQVLTGTTALGLLLGYVVVQQGRLPGALVHTVAIVLGVVFAALQTADAVVGGNRLLLVQHTWQWLQSALFNGGSSSDNTVFLLFLAVLTFLLAYISIWLVVRTRKPWLAVLANGVVLLINLNWASDDKFVFLLLYLLAALLLVVRFTLAENMRQWRLRGLRFSPDLSWDFMQAGAIMAVLVLLVSYLLPVGQANQDLQDYVNSPDNPLQQLQTRWESLFGGLEGNGPGSGGFDFFGSGLHLASSVSLPNVQILHYTTTQTTDDPSQYLLTQTLDSYDGVANWNSSLSQNRSYTAFTQLNASNPYVQENAYNIAFDVSWGADHAIFAPGSEPDSFSVPYNVVLNSQTGQPTSWTGSQPILSGQSYIGRGFVSTATIEELETVQYPTDLSDAARQQQYPDSILNVYRPTSTQFLPEIIKNTALAATQGSTSMYDAAVHLEDYLRTFKYQTQNPKIPDGEDAMTWFLTNKVGFCTFFASAMALMARSLGIPARVALGFTRGTFDPDKKAYIVKGTDAHAWTQLYFGKYGWIDFEPTSGGGLFAKFVRPVDTTTTTPTPIATTSTTPVANVPGLNTHLDDQTPKGTFVNPADTSLGRLGIGLSALLLLLLAIVALFLLWWRLLYRTLSPTAAAFARVTRLGTWAGAPPKRAQTPSEYADELSTLLPAERESLRQLSDLYARERWGGGRAASGADGTNGTNGTGPAAELSRLYERVRVAATSVIVRRVREVPRLIAHGARRLRMRGHRDDDE